MKRNQFQVDAEIEIRRLIGTMIEDARASGRTRMDAAELTAFVPRELEGIIAGVYRKLYATLMGRQYLPMIEGLKPTDETIKYNVYDRTGIAQIISSYADDLPRADIVKDEVRSAVRSIGNAFGYNTDELMASALGLVSLPAEKAEAARDAYEEKFDRILANGDSASGLVGLLNLPNALSYVFPADGAGGGGASKAWANKTADQILRDMHGFYQFMKSQTKGVHVMKRILLPQDQFGIVDTTPRSANSDLTILEYFLRNHKGVEVLEWYKLAGQGAAGTDRMVGYIPDPQFIGYAEPQPFTQFPPQARNLELVVPCKGKSGGVINKYPLTVQYGDGL